MLSAKTNTKEYNILGFIVPGYEIVTASAGIITGYILLLGVFRLIVILGK